MAECSTELRDIEDLLMGDLAEEPRKEFKTHQVKRKKKKEEKPEEPAYEPRFIQNVPGTQKIYVKTFGCSHNMSDSEFMMGQLSEYGYKMVEDPQDADLLLINSCTVKNPSQDAFMT